MMKQSFNQEFPQYFSEWDDPTNFRCGLLPLFYAGCLILGPVGWFFAAVQYWNLNCTKAAKDFQKHQAKVQRVAKARATRAANLAKKLR